MGAVFCAHGCCFHRFDEITEHLFRLGAAALQCLHSNGELVRTPAGAGGDHKIGRFAVKLPYRFAVVALSMQGCILHKDDPVLATLKQQAERVV